VTGTVRGTLLVTAKAPQPRRVKTRLYPPRTLGQAAGIAAAIAIVSEPVVAMTSAANSPASGRPNGPSLRSQCTSIG
jgi:hypothetical protein